MPSIGRPVQVVKIENNQLFFQKSTVSEIFLDDEIKDRKIVVISVAGSFRKGKSFLLGFFLKYLKQTYKNKKVNVDSGWLNCDDESPLEGFAWRGGSKRETTGINMWSEVFLYDGPSEKIAIVLFDTQGVFDNQTTMKENVSIFSLSTLLSSVQIYNIMQQIQEDDLQNLQLFSGYGRMALNEGGFTPFQDLIFLIRDWRFPYEHPFGFKGGASYLKSFLRIKENQQTELQNLRKELDLCFAEMKCFLMAYPGEKVSFDPNFDGRHKDISPGFIEGIRSLVPKLLSPENLVLKEIGGVPITVSDFLTSLETYVSVFNKDDIPSPKSLYQTTAEISQMKAFDTAISSYKTDMEEVSNNQNGVEPDLFKDYYLKAKKKSEKLFKETKKIGDVEMENSFLQKLTKEIDTLYEISKNANDLKYVLYLYKSIMTSEIEKSENIEPSSFEKIHLAALEDCKNKYKVINDSDDAKLLNHINDLYTSYKQTNDAKYKASQMQIENKNIQTEINQIKKDNELKFEKLQAENNAKIEKLQAELNNKNDNEKGFDLVSDVIAPLISIPLAPIAPAITPLANLFSKFGKK